MKMHAEVHTAGNQPIPGARCGTMDEVLAWSWAMAEESRRVIIKRGRPREVCDGVVIINRRTA